MPATHPFAIKLERAIEHAKRVRDAMKKAKEEGDKKSKESDEPERRGGGGGDSGGRNAIPGRKKDPPKDPEFARLKAAYDKARSRCNAALARANEAYYRCLASPNGSPERCRPLSRGVECPDVERRWQALSEYVAQQAGGRIGPGADDPNSGGGGGGGF